MNELTKDDLILVKQGLEAQLQEQLASLQFTKGALQLAVQLLEKLGQDELPENEVQK